ncbi:predicted protein [Scheffersomyces stipitis CBS 6054]|uniref:DNA replication factor Cdt1 C-terminal domain-containing protein n=1 Tax=Scheffersomyces stipitis (strain ATCC 58785 / CBS 6054 / NBRC 10063 / NRRL Y-11545) TaxID=322104 RepID=A3LVX2_PICST|nr:predicted protein [Scheffersomyces stipitis CBS 6054]ABN66859.2 predicted protein [Scheffersomyces stipitis CBS 6054]
MDINPHPHIPKHIFEDLIKKFHYIDTTLSLHYAAHTTDPLVTNLLDTAAEMGQKRIKVSDLECIICVDSSTYFLYKKGDNYYDYSQIYLKIPGIFSPKSLSQRKSAFTQQVNKWIAENQGRASLHCQPVEEILKQNEQISTITSDSLPLVTSALSISSASSTSTSSKSSPTKIVKPRSGSSSPTKRKGGILLSDLKNDSSKFKFQSRDEEVEKQKSNGLSLLDRIRLKEKLQKEKDREDEINNSPQKKYERYLLDKSIPIYDMIYQMTKENQLGSTDQAKEQPTTLSVTKLTAIITDSMSYPIEKDEIVDALNLMEKKLKDLCLFNIIRRNDIVVLKVGQLSRDRDLQMLRK